ncbi:DUF1569 domain-containing protein [Marivirga sp. S37H4]|uniref:DUF1569 domain-containing protein n=1 Tax=Marivirga aurantiaca TaxID=2802615 RepID=A0A935CB76_9BACT|nr:DUF1569 domain-containing protein [Marivirga aurantiaca]MBK6267161.1 DUF1569 domain-containing protein [Marivirga aurantiaca]
MKSILDKNTVVEMIDRINSLTPQSKAQWGKMDAYQMLKHCTLSEEMFLGRKKYERLFIGRLFGKMALKSILKDESRLKPNGPTHPELKITGSGNFEAEKNKWIELLNEYIRFSNPHFVHPFFGKMSNDQIGQYIYKHADHHLRQFNH